MLSSIEHLKLPSGIDYDAEFLRLQRQLLLIQRTYFRQQRRAMVLFEGWDAAGKGGVIRRMTEKMDPRGFRSECKGGIEKES